MKTVAFFLLVFIACLPVSAQTNLNRMGILNVSADIMQNPDQFVGNENIRSIVIDKTTREIPEYAFMGTSVRDVIFQPPSFVNAIPEGAFSENYDLVSVLLYDRNSRISPLSLITTIGPYAFSGCNKLQQVKLPPSLKEIQFAAFSRSGITRLYVPDSVENIGHSIFFDCLHIESIRLPANINIGAQNGFYETYVNNGKSAGIYFMRNNIWWYNRESQDMSEAEYYNDRRIEF